MQIIMSGYARISIHALLAESDLFTLLCNLLHNNFYPRSPCGERHSGNPQTRQRDAISIHALLAESDQGEERANQSGHYISIHALLAESDRLKPRQTRTDTNFYPRSPCGERQPWRKYRTADKAFLSTLSLRRATAIQHSQIDKHYNFYPRSPCGERLHAPSHNLCLRNNFYPRSPCGERRQTKQTCRAETSISIHALLAESDQ